MMDSPRKELRETLQKDGTNIRSQRMRRRDPAVTGSEGHSKKRKERVENTGDMPFFFN